MRGSIGTRSLILTAVAALLFTVASSSVTLAQGRGNGKGNGRGNGDWSNRVERNRSTSVWQNSTGRDRKYAKKYYKKCGKFVNCHDARAGRVDGRGARGTRVGNVVWRNRYNNNTWRNRNRRTVRRVYQNR